MAETQLRSMTGFGRAEGVVQDRKVTVELRALNSKQLDLQVRLPGLYKEREHELRALLSERLVRGKADAFIAAEPLHAARRAAFDADLVQAYHDELAAIRDRVAPGAQTDLLGIVLRMPDVAAARQELTDAEWQGVMALARAALEGLDAFRCQEGARLAEELAARAHAVEELLGEVEAMDAGRAARTRERLLARLEELRAQVDRDRFEQEMVYYLEKLDITEEKVRLRGHCAYFRETLAEREPQGRKLGFIAQEMGREINTLGSKANDAAMQRLVVRMKDELEKIKEQALNVL